MSHEDTWSGRLADAVNSQFHEDRTVVELLFVKAPTRDSVELVYRTPGDVYLRGIRLDIESVRQGPKVIRESTIEELASYLIHVGICEPRALSEFRPPDEHGVAWLHTDLWLDEIG
jgi:hypothetical protein